MDTGGPDPARVDDLNGFWISLSETPKVTRQIRTRLNGR